MKRTAKTLLLLSAVCGVATTNAATKQLANGLKNDDGWLQVQTHCSACHSLQLVTANSGDRTAWLNTIRWMQKNHNLWQFDETTEDAILTYLAKNYSAAKAQRRKPLPLDLMP